jgi:hypothetical protein
MTQSLEERASGTALIAGAVGLAAYAVLIPLLLPGVGGKVDFVAWVTHPAWRGLCLLAMVSLVALMFGFAGLYAHMRSGTGVAALIGFIAVEIAFLMMVCTVSAEFLHYPVVGAHADTAHLLRDRTIYNDPAVAAFRNTALGASAVGLLLFNTALIRSGAFGKWPPMLALTGAIGVSLAGVSVFLELAGILLLGLGCVWMGLRLIQGQSRAL